MVITFLHPRDFMVSLNIKDAYLHVTIFLTYQRYTAFVMHHFSSFLPLPLVCSLHWVFCKVLTPVLALLFTQGIPNAGYLESLFLGEQLVQSVCQCPTGGTDSAELQIIPEIPSLE